MRSLLLLPKTSQPIQEGSPQRRALVRVQQVIENLILNYMIDICIIESYDYFYKIVTIFFFYHDRI